MNKNAINDLITVILSVNASGIFRQGWQPDELAKVIVVYKQQNEVENGTLAVVSFKDSSEVLLRKVYKTANGFVLNALGNPDRPDEYISPIVLAAEEAKEKLTILGKVVESRIVLK